MEAAAKRFEQEDGILKEILKEMKSEKNIYSCPLSNMFQMAEANGYTPYCEMKFDSIANFCTTSKLSTNNQEHMRSQFVSRPEDEVNANFKLGSPDCEENCERISNDTSESFQSSLQYECPNKSMGNVRRLEKKLIVDNKSDDSDSGIFRVKRPSSLKAERRNIRGATFSTNSGQQELKQLKKDLHEGRSVPQVDMRKRKERSYKYSDGVSHKVNNGKISSRDKFARGNSIPVSVRYKKRSNGEVNRRRHHCRTDRLLHSIEVAPKRLKARDPSFMGINSRLN
ncbi:uncharacterized protein LOC124841333 isoform X2 [Vigna umbellata]|uniref:uncharacterized protein LOC124841333 isoform X2 n=1 Tax=Vigna umbellata TaxID=87088 RepID=UPI001F5E5C41|nr:uncharacterized protein LOC124841333 isoform X2 [Vigna umbellata]